DKEPIKMRDEMCEALKTREITPATQGFIIFPDDEKNPVVRFNLPSIEVRLWRATFQTIKQVPVIVGCIDYVSVDTSMHHETGFIFEIDKRGKHRPFENIDPNAGDISEDDLSISQNPTLP